MLDTTTSAIAFVADGADETNHLAGQGVIAVVPTICGSPSKDALACGDRLDRSGSGAGLGRAIVGDIAEAWELSQVREAGARIAAK